MVFVFFLECYRRFNVRVLIDATVGSDMAFNLFSSGQE